MRKQRRDGTRFDQEENFDFVGLENEQQFPKLCYFHTAEELDEMLARAGSRRGEDP